MFTLAWVCFTSISDSALAQYPSEQGRFTVNQVRGCAPLAVEVVAEDEAQLSGNTSPRVYKFNYDGNLSQVFVDEDQTDQDTLYRVPGTYKILQVVGDVLDTITIEVLEPRPPEVQVFTCINHGVFLEINDDYYDRLRIDYGDGTTTEVVTDLAATFYNYATPGSYSIGIQGLFDDADSDNCAITDTTITTINTLTVADVNTVTVLSGTSVRLNYSLPNPNVSYRLEVAEAGSDDFDFARYNLNGEEEFTTDDPTFRTGEQSYCFRVVAVNRCDESQNLVSDGVCSIALQAEPQDQQNQLSWMAEGFTDYDLSRNGSPLAATTDRAFLDTDVVCQQVYEYQITASSEAGLSTSERVAVTAISETVSPAPDSVATQVVGPQIWLTARATKTTTQYYIYRGSDDQSPALYDSARAEDVQLRAYEDTDVATGTAYCYQLSYVDDCGNESARSEPVCVTIPQRGEVFFPNAFTPNGDGLNDTFVYQSRLVESIEMQIYNRWGELVFQTDELDVGWDGRYRGGIAPQETYVYSVRVVDQLGNSFEQEGSFVLLSP